MNFRRIIASGIWIMTLFLSGMIAAAARFVDYDHIHGYSKRWGRWVDRGTTVY